MKPKNPQDATRRNVQAANKRIARLVSMLNDVLRRIRQLEKAVRQSPAR